MTRTLPLLALLACGAKDAPPEDSGDDSAPSDDSTPPEDTGIEVAPTPWEALSGTMTYVSTFEGAEWCDATIGLEAAPYEGDCEGCDFALDVQAEIVADDSVPSCALYPPYALLEQHYGWWNFFDFVLAYGPYYEEGDALMSGYGVSYYYYGEWYIGESPYYWRALAFGGDPGLRWDERGLSWSVDIDWYTYPLYTFASYCYAYTWSEATAAYGGDWEASGTLPCDGSGFDIWSLDASAGDTVAVSVDTVASETAFGPTLFLSDASGCMLAYAEDNFDCTHGAYDCPALSVPVDGAGPWRVGVYVGESCGRGEGAYRLQVDAPADPALEQIVDDMVFYGTELVHVEASLSAP